MFTTKKIAIVSVINDLVTDNRVNRTCMTLVERGYEVHLIGRFLPGSLPVPAWPFQTTRMKMLFKSGPAFYFFFMWRLFFRLLFKKADLLFSNDLDTLLPNYLVSKIKNIPLIYDSHELFCEVPELQKTPAKRKAWLMIESAIVPRLRHCITVNESIAEIFSTQYKVGFNVVRNITDAPKGFVPKTKEQLGLPPDKKIVLLQGAGINIDRGAEELVEAMRYVEGAVLLIIGSGDCWSLLKQKKEEKALKDKVIMIEKLSKSDLMHYTYNADLGVSIDKNTNPNYYNSLPNKIFDYLHAGVPVLASHLPEIEKVITGFDVGDYINGYEPQHIAGKITDLLGSPRLFAYKNNTARARAALNWDTEKIKLSEVITRAAENRQRVI
ncbi:MAG TPA: glycosyltransferase [Bacteroidia bacterium]|nr:glycosyltransferase [Bacteroidia bacterium]